MYAVVKTGGKQYRVAKDDVLKIERLPGDEGDIITLEEVLMLGDGAVVTVGAPLVAGASVAAEIVEQARGPKIVIFKKRRRQNYRRKKGHRQLLTVVKITDILTDGAKPSAKKAAAKKPAAKKETAPAADFVDDVSLIGGVGPKLKEKLAGYGVTSLKKIAKMSEADVAKMDEALELHGRATRDEWVEQAKELVAGKPPRAKTDRARADEE
ncbi:MAG: 50S ribosomal protein L21 [Alphaproteobacteria bacterium RIFCSPHIGHO2_12_FULL_63_12]|nr:MAG: 50S ribosomal protein L21 [Alphaproteobacteria bacterium RIFCSPHIGHO2_12_FULL_63_12]